MRETEDERQNTAAGNAEDIIWKSFLELPLPEKAMVDLVDLDRQKEENREVCEEDEILPMLVRISDAKEEEAWSDPAVVNGYRAVREKLKKSGGEKLTDE